MVGLNASERQALTPGLVIAEVFPPLFSATSPGGELPLGLSLY
jgi:hypothetical protein